jgi:uncharacterized repeat protein (TIGR01451 family)
VGDILILSDFTQGGTVSTIKVLQWVGSGGDTNDTLNLLGGIVDCSETASSDFVCATVNETDTLSPWPYTPKSGTDGYFPPGSFFEGGIVLNHFMPEGLSCFSSFLAETRASQSVDATLKDFVLGDFNLCELVVTKEGPEKSMVGDDVTYTVNITNDGALTLWKQSIIDSLAGKLTDSDDPAIASSNCGTSLAPNEYCTIAYTYPIVQPGDLDTLTNTISVTYNTKHDFEGDEVYGSDDHTVNLFQPSISFDKTGDTTLSKVGDEVNYTITLNNTSSADTPDLECTITDAMLGVDKNVRLVSGASDVTNATYKVKVVDPDPLVNNASTSCSPVGFPNVLDASDDHTIGTVPSNTTYCPLISR